jgi:hypothetical protein
MERTINVKSMKHDRSNAVPTPFGHPFCRYDESHQNFVTTSLATPSTTTTTTTTSGNNNNNNNSDTRAMF